MVRSAGEHSRRGGILDIWPPADSFPTRIEFFGESIESMRRFDPSTQRSINKVDVLNIHPARETLPKNGPAVALTLMEQWSPVHSTNIVSDHQNDFELLSTGSTFPELEYYIKAMSQLQDKVAFLQKEIDITSLIIQMIEQEKVLTIEEKQSKLIKVLSERREHGSDN